MFTSKGVLNPTRFVRVLWGGSQLLMVAVLLLSGGLDGLRTDSIIAAFPFMPLMVLIAFALYKDLAWEFQQRDEKARLLNTRLKHLLLRESEREAERLAEEESHASTPEEAPTVSPSNGPSRT